ncbi:MAG: GTP cyclohydrolase I FolE [Candidatus Wallbacteria bacterium]|nr:GTP cyclohydrolase I FolE [Candidatus Wallbacteria bacterium]
MMDKPRIEKAFSEILAAIGENPSREGLRDTPRRIADMYEDIFAGLDQDPSAVLNVFYQESHEEIVIVKDIPLYSICEHHFLPFHGLAHIGYIPKNGRIVGISKLARVLDILSRRPQLQERLTTQLADILMEKLDPLGVIVVIKAEHMCMSMRGVKKPGSMTVTSAIRGLFEHDAPAKAEALQLFESR